MRHASSSASSRMLSSARTPPRLASICLATSAASNGILLAPHRYRTKVHLQALGGKLFHLLSRANAKIEVFHSPTAIAARHLRVSMQHGCQGYAQSAIVVGWVVVDKSGLYREASSYEFIT